MCHEVLVRSEGLGDMFCDSVGTLAFALGVSPSFVSKDPVDHCLCNFDIEATGARKATVEEGYPYPSHIIEMA